MYNMNYYMIEQGRTQTQENKTITISASAIPSYVTNKHTVCDNRLTTVIIALGIACKHTKANQTQCTEAGQLRETWQQMYIVNTTVTTLLSPSTLIQTVQ